MPLSSVLGAQSLVRPGVCTSSTRPASPFEGQVIYETDTDRIMSWNGSTWQFASTPQATESGYYTSYTPTWTNLTVGNGTQDFSYTRIGNHVHAQGKLTFGSTTSISGLVTMTLPVTPGASLDGLIVGSCMMVDTGSAIYIAQLVGSGTACVLRASNASSTYLYTADTSSTVPYTWANTDTIGINAIYKV